MPQPASIVGSSLSGTSRMPRAQIAMGHSPGTGVPRRSAMSETGWGVQWRECPWRGQGWSSLWDVRGDGRRGGAMVEPGGWGLGDSGWHSLGSGQSWDSCAHWGMGCAGCRSPTSSRPFNKEPRVFWATDPSQQWPLSTCPGARCLVCVEVRSGWGSEGSLQGRCRHRLAASRAVLWSPPGSLLWFLPQVSGVSAILGPRHSLHWVLRG